MLEISKMLTISTCHVSEQTAKQLENNEFADIVVYEKADENEYYGWFIYVTDDIDVLEGYEIPEDLYKCMRVAFDYCCNWLCMDRDADVVNGLETYDW